MCPMYDVSVRSDLILFKMVIDPLKKNKKKTKTNRKITSLSPFKFVAAVINYL